MRRDILDLSDNSRAAGQPRQRAHNPTRGAIFEWIARPTRIAILVALGLTSGLLSTACSQQVPQANTITVPTPAPTIVEQVASPEATLAFAEVSTPTPSPVVTTEAWTASLVPFVAEPAADEVSPVEVAVSPADESIVNQDKLLAEARAQLSSRGGNRTDVSTEATAESATPTSQPTSQHQIVIVTEVVKAAAAPTKAPTARPVAKVATKTVAKPAATSVAKPAATSVAKPAATTASSSSLGQRVVSVALRYVGYRYTSGGISPSTGFDCSGFTYYVYKTAGHPISRALSSQYATGSYVSRANLQPGDLVFFQNTYKAGLSHVAIYIGGGRIVHARSETTGVTTDSLSTTYWSSHYLGARRP